MDAAAQRNRLVLVVLAAIALLSGAFAAMDLQSASFTGYQTDGDNVVTQLRRGGPADLAGMRVGDRIVSINGVRVTDTRRMMRTPRADIGEPRLYVVQRAGGTAELMVTASALPTRDRSAAFLSSLIGLVFVGLCLGAYLMTPYHATLVLSLFGSAFGLAFLGVPYFRAAGLRLATSMATTIVILLGFALLLHFLWLTPRRLHLATTRRRLAVYGPAAALALLILGMVIAQPASTTAVNVFMRSMIGVVLAGYFIAALAVLIARYMRADAKTRKAEGLTAMLWGAIIALGPLTIELLLQVLAPRLVLPGGDLYFLTLVAAPIAFSIAAVRSAGQIEEEVPERVHARV